MIIPTGSRAVLYAPGLLWIFVVPPTLLQICTLVSRSTTKVLFTMAFADIVSCRNELENPLNFRLLLHILHAIVTR
jgi:hypothetical protein